MNHSSDIKECELICLIVNHGLGSKVLKIAKQNGISGGTIMLGKGTVSNRILEFFEIADIRKEIVIMISEKELALNVLEVLDRQLSLHKPNHGIAFTMPVSGFHGISSFGNYKETVSGGVDNIMYKAIYVIVDRGDGDAVVDAAKRAGARGATIIHGRGSGIHETTTVFHMAIEPEKDIVLILAKNEVVEPIVSAINTEMKIEEPGKGIMFILDVNKTYGIV